MPTHVTGMSPLSKSNFQGKPGTSRIRAEPLRAAPLPPGTSALTATAAGDEAASGDT